LRFVHFAFRFKRRNLKGINAGLPTSDWSQCGYHWVHLRLPPLLLLVPIYYSGWEKQVGLSDLLKDTMKQKGVRARVEPETSSSGAQLSATTHCLLPRWVAVVQH
jgi:hypothetical protein